jgi:hypothetical protein
VEQAHAGPGHEIMTAHWLRANLPSAWLEEWLANYRKAQDVIERNHTIEDRRWSGPQSS